MTEHRRKDDGLPRWLSISVVIWCMAGITYNMIVVGPEGYPISIMLGGIMGGYGGVNEAIKLRRAKAAAADREPGDTEP